MESKNTQSRYNLPSEVKFCKKCTISNQRPRITFDENVVCSACNFADYKKTKIDWKIRENELESYGSTRIIEECESVGIPIRTVHPTTVDVIVNRNDRKSIRVEAEVTDLPSLVLPRIGSSTDYYAFNQDIEGFNAADLAFGTADAETVTLSFLVRSSVTGTYAVALYNNGGTRGYPATYTISSANTWTFISLTIPGDTGGTWVTNNGVGITVRYDLGTGSNGNGTANTWNTSGSFAASRTQRIFI
jgi:hypothetical protein